MMRMIRKSTSVYCCLWLVVAAINSVDCRTSVNHKRRLTSHDVYKNELQNLEHSPHIHEEDVVAHPGTLTDQPNYYSTFEAKGAATVKDSGHASEHEASNEDTTSGKGKGKGKGSDSSRSGKGKGSDSSRSGKGKGKGRHSAHAPHSGKGKGHSVSHEDESGSSKGKGKGKGEYVSRSKSSHGGKGTESPRSEPKEHDDCVEASEDKERISKEDSENSASKKSRRLKGHVECDSTDTHPDTHAPIPTSSPSAEQPGSEDRETEAPTEEAFEPEPSPTEGPTEATDDANVPSRSRGIAVDVSDFGLEYDVKSERLPLREELDALTSLTDGYLKEFMEELFDQPPMTTIEDFGTDYMTGSFNMMEDLIHIEFESTASVSAESEVVPTTKHFDEAIIMAFMGDNLAAYVELLRTMPSENIFSDVDGVRLLGTERAEPDETVDEDPPTRRARGVSGGAIAAGAVAITLLAAGVAIYKRGEEEEDEFDEDGKKMDKIRGDGTIADETYADTYDGTASLSVSSLDFGGTAYTNHRDVEGGESPARHMDTIAEGNDDSSIVPTWETNSTAEQEEEKEEVEALEHVLSSASTIDDDGFDDEFIPYQGTKTDPVVAPAMDYDDFESSSICSDIQSMLNEEFEDEYDPSVPIVHHSSPELDQLQGFDSMEIVSTSAPIHRSETADTVQCEAKSDASDDDHIDQSSSKLMKTKETGEIDAFLSYCLEEPIDEVQNDTSSTPAATTSDDDMTASTRPRTVSEIEAMLTSEDSIVGADLIEDDSSVITKPRSVAEIESMLSIDLDD